MGAGASTKRGKGKGKAAVKGGDGGSTSTTSVTATGPGGGGGGSVDAVEAPPEAPPMSQYTVNGLSLPESLPLMDGLKLRMADEALSICAPTGIVMHVFPYHRIMCWGHTPETFQFRAYMTEDSRLETIVFKTKQGSDMEAAIMRHVQHLMKRMTQVGIGASEFAELCGLLKEDGDRALAATRQASMTRLFDIKQAVEVVQMIGELSPFDKVEAACIMHGKLISNDSFPIILDAFEDPVDRDNVLQRLKLELTPDGKAVKRKRK